MSSISFRRDTSKHHLLEEYDSDSIESEIPTPFPTQFLYPQLHPVVAPPPLNTRIITPRPPATEPTPLNTRIITPRPPSAAPAPTTTTASYEQSSSSSAYLPPAYVGYPTLPGEKVERDFEHQKFLLKVLTALDKSEPLDFAKNMLFDKDVPPAPINMLHLALATLRPDAIDLLCRLQSEYIENLGKFVFDQLYYDTAKGNIKKLDSYPLFLLEITKKNPEKIPPHFLLKYYLTAKEKKFPQRKVHETILRGMISTYRLTPAQILATLDKAQLAKINTVSATMMEITTVDILLAKKQG